LPATLARAARSRASPAPERSVGIGFGGIAAEPNTNISFLWAAAPPSEPPFAAAIDPDAPDGVVFYGSAVKNNTILLPGSSTNQLDTANHWLYASP
jgi:hypothetical protein